MNLASASAGARIGRKKNRRAKGCQWTHKRLTPLTLKKFQLVCFWATIAPRPRRDHLLHTFRDVLPIDMEVLELLSDFALVPQLVPRPTEAEKEEKEAVSLHFIAKYGGLTQDWTSKLGGGRN